VPKESKKTDTKNKNNVTSKYKPYIISAIIAAIIASIVSIMLYPLFSILSSEMLVITGVQDKPEEYVNVYIEDTFSDGLKNHVGKKLEFLDGIVWKNSYDLYRVHIDCKNNTPIENVYVSIEFPGTVLYCHSDSIGGTEVIVKPIGTLQIFNPDIPAFLENIYYNKYIIKADRISFDEAIFVNFIVDRNYYSSPEYYYFKLSYPTGEILIEYDWYINSLCKHVSKTSKIDFTGHEDLLELMQDKYTLWEINRNYLQISIDQFNSNPIPESSIFPP